jgi:hypothetical protein
MAEHIEGYGDGSLSYLFQILVPRFISDDRPEFGPYEHFAAVAGFPGKTGWGMNLMTDCYVNYGIVTMVAAAGCLGLVYWALFAYGLRRPIGQFLFSGAVAAFPLAIRSGIPGIKSVLITAAVWGLCFFLATASQRTSPKTVPIYRIGNCVEIGADR